MAQLLEAGIDRHQRGHNLHPVLAGTAAGVNPAGYLVQVIAHAGKLAQQHRRDRGKFAGAGRLLTEARLTHPGRQLLAVAALEQPAVLVLRHPHGEHLVPFL